MVLSINLPLAGTRDCWKRRFHGLAIAVLIALAAAFLSEHYGAPAMLLAILIGLALHFLSDDARSSPGLDYASRSLLRAGIALLGLRISVGMFTDLGLSLVLVVLAAVAATIGFGLIAARCVGQDNRFGALTGAAVAICGASAAMAVAAVLGRGDGRQAEREMVFVVIGVTILSTLAMIAYPLVAAALDLSELSTGIFLGATIHDVAQVAGAGFSVSVPAGEMAVFVKLIRVTMLAPVVLIVALAFRHSSTPNTSRPPIIPAFVMVFLVLAAVNSLVALPAVVGQAASALSQWALLTAIAAVGVKTSLPAILGVGRRAIGVLVAETVFLATFMLLALFVLHPSGS